MRRVTVPGYSRAMSMAVMRLGQLATAVDYAFDADFLGLFQQFVDAVYGDFRLSFFDGFVAHGPRKRNDGCHMRMVVDDVRVVGQRRWRGAQLRSR